MNMTDAHLVRTYLEQGDEQALETLVRRHMTAVFALVRTYTGNPDTAADITQESFVKAWKNLKRFDQSMNFRTWLFTIAKRTAIDELKRKGAVPFSFIAPADTDIAGSVADTSPSILQELSMREQAGVLAGVVGALPGAHGEVILMHLQDGLTFQEISDAIKKPLNTVKSHYRRGLLALRNAFPRE